MSSSRQRFYAAGLALCVAGVACKGKSGSPTSQQNNKAGTNVKRPLESKIPLEAVAKRPRPGTSLPGAFAFSPDGKAITFLDSADKSLTRQLYQFDLATKKRSVVLDLKLEQGQSVARRLLETADVLVANFRPGVAERLGLGYEALGRHGSGEERSP